MRRLLPAVFVLALWIALLYALGRPWGSIPPLGKLLNPAAGFWANAETENPALVGELNLPGLLAPVRVETDQRLVPHIFAQNETDLYRVKGYLDARFRLFQMEFTARAAEGSISQVIGPRALRYDLGRRRVGMKEGALRDVAAARKDTAMWQILTAYAEGVNAYVDALTPADYPLEYKLLDAAPARWSPYHTTLVAQAMDWDLTGSFSDVTMSYTRQALGDSATRALFPNYPANQDPIIPAGTPWDFKPLPTPAAPTPVSELPKPEHNLALMQQLPKPDKDWGSNNWAVGPGRSASGHPLLSDDMHLSLRLPSIWSEVQLHCPTHNVYGVSIPGVPVVVVGFNEHVSWGPTNVSADQFDIYSVEFQDSTYRTYRHAGQWKPTTRLIDTVYVRDMPPVVDTIYYTHHGPIPFLKDTAQRFYPRHAAMRWIGHDPDVKLHTFWLLNRARGYEDYLRATGTFVSPGQNFNFIDREGNIALRVSGKFALKWPEQGKFVANGSQAANDWQGWIPAEHNPLVKNPPRGWTSSANQQSAPPDYPYYLDWDQAPYERGKRINDRLRAMPRATWDSLRVLQNDAFSLHAQSILPTLLKYLPPDKPGPQLAALQQWDYHYTPGSRAATLFYVWWSCLNKAIWNDELPPATHEQPNRDRTVQLITETPGAVFFDNIYTPEKETLAQLAAQTFTQAVDSLTGRLGPWEETGWEWSRYKATTITHMLSIEAFSRQSLNGGCAECVNASKPGNTGPSWRMVVEMTADGPEAYGIYPGGPSGNPGSRFYDNQVPAWTEGRLEKLLFLRRPSEETDGNRVAVFNP